MRLLPLLPVQVEDIRRGVHQESGRPNPYAHVQFTDTGAIAAARALNGTKLLGRELSVASSTPMNRDGQLSNPAHALGERGPRPRRRDGGSGPRAPLPEPGKPVEGCWFCLSSEQARRQFVTERGARGSNLLPCFESMSVVVCVTLCVALYVLLSPPPPTSMLVCDTAQCHGA
jgi:hypothetical protein